MKKLKTVILFVALLMAINNAYAQLSNLEKDEVREIVCEPIDDIFNLQCTDYQNLVTGSDYTAAINKAISDANLNGGGIILFPGNTTVEINSGITVYSNITFRASHSMATISSSDGFTGNQMIILSNRENVSFEDIEFDANKKTRGIVTYGSNNNINVLNCVFKNMINGNGTGAGIYFQDVRDVTIKNCVFRESDFGIDIHKRNSRIRIEKNTFENTLGKNPIRIQGNTDPNDKYFSDHVWILDNDIKIGRATSIIDELSELVRGVDGVVTGLRDVNGKPERVVNGVTLPQEDNYNADYWAWRWGGGIAPSAIYITSGNTAGNHDLSAYANYHQNIVIDGNIAIGPDYGFFDGGTADLFSLKDIIRLKLTNNVARNAGDLGFAIERSRNAIISNNTADRNNSFGMGIATTRNSIISNNIFDNNALRRNFIYNSSPYGGLVLSGYSFNNIIEGNNFYSYSSADVSLAIEDAYTERQSPTQYYGIILRTESYIDPGSGDEGDGDETVLVKPSSNKIGVNHYSGNRWGPIYQEHPISTQIVENFSATDFPKNKDFPVGTWFRNSNLNNSALGWSVVNRVETTIAADWTVGDNQFLIENNDGGTVQVGDVIGIMQDDGNIHWSTIDVLTTSGNNYLITLDTNPTLNVSDAIVDPSAKVAWGMGRVIILRWLTVTK
ncbi:right-handed parallel beta-helix repeat-containing protein [Kordia jejudonensis]|uniref:right-handed parallel beta-helix repeat-containing protein n=1 Tax=Kordia jejudonensis TaxID=1348245 RepID=UPI000629307A|nr:right-handed parallel beta-helix repeat-containing protein [Kordia jejudonensis]